MLYIYRIEQKYSLWVCTPPPRSLIRTHFVLRGLAVEQNERPHGTAGSDLLPRVWGLEQPQVSRQVIRLFAFLVI